MTIFFLIFIYLFLEGKEGRETLMCERYIDQLPLTHSQVGTWPATQACAVAGNQTGNLLVHRLVLNPLSHTSQGTIFSFIFLPSHMDTLTDFRESGREGQRKRERNIGYLSHATLPGTKHAPYICALTGN